LRQQRFFKLLGQIYANVWASGRVISLNGRVISLNGGVILRGLLQRRDEKINL
jgi:hypothetical protein